MSPGMAGPLYCPPRHRAPMSPISTSAILARALVMLRSPPPPRSRGREIFPAPASTRSLSRSSPAWPMRRSRPIGAEEIGGLRAAAGRMRRARPLGILCHPQAGAAALRLQPLAEIGRDRPYRCRHLLLRLAAAPVRRDRPRRLSPSRPIASARSMNGFVIYGQFNAGFIYWRRDPDRMALPGRLSDRLPAMGASPGPSPMEGS